MRDDDDPALLADSRRAWGCLETLHVVGYFAERVRDGYVALGLHPRLSYFAARSAAFGAVGPHVPVATFYVFAPRLHEMALPSSWDVATPAQVQAARREGVAAVLHDLLGDPDVDEALDLARTACEGLRPQGRPLYAAHAGLDWPDDPLLALWHAATLLREHRGDGHVAVLVEAGLDPVEALVLGGAHGGNTDFVRTTRGWTDDEWAAAVQRLRAVGLVEASGPVEQPRLTDEGVRYRQGLEGETDRLAVDGWAHLGRDGTRRLVELVTPWRRAVLDGGVLPDWVSRRG